MLCADIMMIQATSLIDGKLDDLFGAWSESNFTKDDAISPANYKFNGATNLVQFDTEITQYFCGDTFSFSYKAEQEMFGADVIVLEALRFFLSEAQDLPGPLCELIKPISIVHLFVTPLSVAEDGTEPSVSLR